MNAHVRPAHLIPAPTEGRTDDLGWALIKATSAATHYSKVKILRTGKRFTYVQTGAGNEWRVTTRGLWTFPTEAAADAELDTLAHIWRDHMPATQARAAASKPSLTCTEGRTGDRDYADWYEEGEAWVREWCAANKRTQPNDYGIAQLVHDWMRINCPAKLIAEHRAAVKAVRDAEYGAAAFRVGQYGLERF